MAGNRRAGLPCLLGTKVAESFITGAVIIPVDGGIATTK